ncbi:Na/Pi cotransporter family protein [Candidatus Bipolaricaulota bacterium]|nr:Na/Pi cotransporter family protein [Candidatus Bipolaricaulota bacterium]
MENATVLDSSTFGLIEEGRISVLTLFFSAAGGVALFLYGLHVLSSALKRAAGGRMRNLLERLTGRPWRGVIVGAVTSGVLQSSSMTMVLLIGLINAGVLTLSQGVGVMLGSEIGTTFTAQIIAFKIGQYYLPVIAVGFLLSAVGRGRRFHDIGRIILGFGLLFLGMDILSSGLRGLADTPFVLQLLESCGANVLLGVAVGAIVTAIIQSSSAMTAMVIAMGSAGVITLPAAIALVLGANIGTTITAQIASIGSSLSSRRLAIGQLAVNVLGVGVFIPWIPAYARLVEGTAGTLVRQIANAHTIFNIAVTVALIPCVPALVWLAKRLVRGRENAVPVKQEALSRELLQTPVMAINHASQALMTMAETVMRMLESSRKAFLKADLDAVQDTFELEEGVDRFFHDLDSYLNQVDSHGLSDADTRKLHVLRHAVHDLERIGDHAVNIAERGRVRARHVVELSYEARSEVSTLFDRVKEMLDQVLAGLRKEDRTLVESSAAMEKEIDRLEETYKQRHIRRIEAGVCDPEMGVLFVEALRNLERIGDHAMNIAGDVLTL